MATRITISINKWQTPIRMIYIYDGGGVYGESVEKLERLFSYVQGPWEISKVGAQDVVPDKWERKKTLFILPGGKASEYDVHIGEKVKAIRMFVKQGGHFFSVCGGSYFASKCTVYQLMTKERPLGLFKGTAQGPLIPSDTEDISFHHGALQVRWKDSDQKAPVLVSGGGSFIPQREYTNFEVLMSYDDPLIPSELSAAVVKCYVGEGNAILSSLHLGYHATDIDVSVYEKYFPAHNWKQIVENLEGTEAFRVRCFADLILSFSQ